MILSNFEIAENYIFTEFFWIFSIFISEIHGIKFREIKCEIKPEISTSFEIRPSLAIS